MPLLALPAVFMRGGTSRAIMFHAKDLPPRAECAQLWLEKLLAKMPRIELTLLIGQYAQRHFLASRRKSSLAETTKAWREYSPHYIPLPHPSPRNQPWFKRHAWFEEQLIPMLQSRVKALVARWIPPAQILHPYPNDRFYAMHPK